MQRRHTHNLGDKPRRYTSAAGARRPRFNYVHRSGPEAGALLAVLLPRFGASFWRKAKAGIVLI
jgi:hypothetical protein